MHAFTYTPDPKNEYDHVAVTITTDTSSLKGLLEAFESYLKANGFHFVGVVDIVENETPTNPDQS